MNANALTTDLPRTAPDLAPVPGMAPPPAPSSVLHEGHADKIASGRRTA